jgi:hypothetical protein
MLKLVSDFSIEEIINARRTFAKHDPDATLKERFNTIKSAWDEVLPVYIKSCEENKTLAFDPYFYDWIRVFSPIESMAWNEIRANGIPLFPQFPACGYFLDFANPIRKIALECDGAAYHDVNKDFERDSKLIADGWTIFRVTGKECNLYIENPFSCDPDEEEYARQSRIENWFFNSSDGVICAIQKILFPRFKDDYSYDDLCVSTLNMHLSKAHKHIDFFSINYDLKAAL